MCRTRPQGMSSSAVDEGDQLSMFSRMRRGGRSGPRARRTSIRRVPESRARSARAIGFRRFAVCCPALCAASSQLRPGTSRTGRQRSAGTAAIPGLSPCPRSCLPRRGKRSASRAGARRGRTCGYRPGLTHRCRQVSVVVPLDDRVPRDRGADNGDGQDHFGERAQGHAGGSARAENATGMLQNGLEENQPCDRRDRGDTEEHAGVRTTLTGDDRWIVLAYPAPAECPSAVLAMPEGRVACENWRIEVTRA